MINLTRRTISTVELGTLYEHHVVKVFNQLGAKVHRVGGARDLGIDFVGPWSLPGHPAFHLCGQCKHYEKKRVGPSIIREFEGVLSRQPLDTLGVVASSCGYTPGSLDATMSSSYPICLVTAQLSQELSGMVWNRSADSFIGRMMVCKKHYDTLVHTKGAGDFTLELLWDGHPLKNPAQ